jgi:hypothetical protein
MAQEVTEFGREAITTVALRGSDGLASVVIRDGVVAQDFSSAQSK